MKGVTGLVGLTLLLFSMTGFADGNPLVGTWKLQSYVLTTTGERSTPFGEHPSGYLSYSADGRMYAIGTADDRIMPHDIVATDAERVKLHRAMFAYAGTYSVERDKVIHHVDISWNQVWNGTNQVRFYKLTGDTLTITTAYARSAYDGRESQSVLVWKKVAATP
jgi:Lipocalin-like domain